ncbi:sensor histidine kinase [Paenibacillus amylolyticus]|uniref:Integral membrane sensor signal transduction histidine kinase n=1 Tax=Paenibacillus amylolyticus TaxID=1451 RepID=A0A100VJK7_PAEAM|nr:sensor histidine kinase [Paenibacillus amylolyticus]GAS80904.1 integral membrane sensor signal transduction histidine kinase [Paenibacillus amylolyticus]
MSYRTNLFSKMVILILIMLIPVVLLYWYSNHKTTAVLRDELNRSNSNQLEFFQNQVNTHIELLSSWPNLLIHDPDIASFRRIYADSKYFDLDAINLVKRIQNKLSIQESSSNWATKLYLYSPSLGRVVSERDARSYDKEALRENISSGWDVRKIQDGEDDRFMFSWITVSPYGIKDPVNNAETIIKLEFDSDNIRDMLDKFKDDGRHDPFYFREESGVIYNRTSDRSLTNQLMEELSIHKLQDVDNRTVVIGNEPYMVNTVKSSTTGWYLVDYMPLSDILKPIHQSNMLFYSSMICLLLMSFGVAYLLYVQVQVPVKQLIRGFQRLKQEDYSVRIKPKGRNEFSFLSERFNLMVEQIQQLFEHVYLEQIHVREARLKQLQSQINPHFFYNCFSFITSMAKLKRMDAVVAMSHNLSRYYRYTTRQERDVVPLTEEIEFVSCYLEIQRMRMDRIHYKLDLSEEMLRQEVPPLIVQPLVENAVIHGIEADAEAGEIRVSGEKQGGVMVLVVEDDGQGMTQEAREALSNKLRGTMDQEMGCGLWNVNQRLQLRYGEQAGIDITESELGGLRVTLSWPAKQEYLLENEE